MPDSPLNPPTLNPPMSDLRQALSSIAQNYSWVWDNARKALLVQAVGPDWRGEVHPYKALQSLTEEDLGRLSKDRTFVADALAQASELKELEGHLTSRPDVAYFSPEFGISETLPQYSGGLGILAGDHLKAVSDLGIPLVGVGLFYANGYFEQGLTKNQQSVSYATYQPAELGLVDMGRKISVETPRGPIHASIWLAKVGATQLYVLDARVEENEPWAKAVTDRLYGGDQAHRIEQEWLLGVGGLRALQAMDIRPKVLHLNEGHAGFLLLELLAEQLNTGVDLDSARARIRCRTLFTTHTPVPAGIDRFPVTLLRPYLDLWATELPAGTAQAVWDSGALPSETEGDLFNMAAFCLRHAGLSNGVSALHGTVSQSLFGSLDEGSAITSVTNGVHARTWMARSVQDLLDEVVGKDFSQADEERWSATGAIPDSTVRQLRNQLRADLVTYLRQAHGFDGFDPYTLTVGFARRFATYKRAALLLLERDALVAMLNNDEHPIQFVFAGKAHPADTQGQKVFRQIAEFSASPEANGRFILVPGYDISVANMLYGGCDVWLNNPVRPQEACGTSGEKSALNGGLNCSILDGWWAEWFQPQNGWAIATSEETNPAKRDRAEAAGVLKLFREQIIPTFYADAFATGPSNANIPGSEWNDRIRYGWQYLGPRVTAARMVSDYNQQLYEPLCAPCETSEPMRQ